MWKTCNFTPFYVHLVINVIGSNGKLQTHNIFKKEKKHVIV